MANTKALAPAERKNKKKEARKKHKELFKSLSKEDRKKFLVQIRDKKSKSKQGIVAFTDNLKKEKEAKKESATPAEKTEAKTEEAAE